MTNEVRRVKAVQEYADMEAALLPGVMGVNKGINKEEGRGSDQDWGRDEIMYCMMDHGSEINIVIRLLELWEVAY